MARKRASGAKAPALSSTGEVTADASLAQAQKNAEYFRKLLADMHAHGGMGEAREADYKGHHIVIQTAYKITVDGKPFEAGLGVSNDGSVHYHGMPNVGFDSAIDRHFSTVPSNFYPEPQGEPLPDQLRAGPHTDFGSLTILAVNDAPGGLQVRFPDGAWHDVRPAPGQLVVNLGDMMERWTNDRWKSTVHRVVNPPRDRASGSRRHAA